MGDVVGSLFGPSSAEKAQARRLRRQQQRQDAVEAGQAALRNAGRGLLAFIDDDESNRTLGGGDGGGESGGEGRRTRRRSALTSRARTMGGSA